MCTCNIPSIEIISIILMISSYVFNGLSKSRYFRNFILCLVVNNFTLYNSLLLNYYTYYYAVYAQRTFNLNADQLLPSVGNKICRKKMDIIAPRSFILSFIRFYHFF